MVDLDFENIWIYTAVTVSLWILIFTALELLFSNGNIWDGIIPGLFGGISYAAAYRLFQKYS